MLDAGSLPPWSLVGLVLSIAFLYASVGFGGASGYLMAMSLFLLPPQVMSSTALMLNLLVSSIAFTAYYRAQHFAPRLTWPFLLTSVPAAFLGGYIEVDSQVYLILLYGSLSYVAYRMLIFKKPETSEPVSPHDISVGWPMLCGAGIGLLSGILGIGGGIFLSPLIVLTGWGSPKQAAASSAAFIFVNSASGLTGRLFGGSLVLGSLGFALLPLGLLGALGGSRLGARYLSGDGVRRVLGAILLIAVLRFWVSLLV